MNINSLENNLKKLDKFEKYEDNWDGYGAFKYNKELLNDLRKLLPKLSRQPQVFPSASGIVQMEYRGGNCELMIIRYSNKNQLEAIKFYKNDKAEEFLIDNNLESINKFIKEYYQ